MTSPRTAGGRHRWARVRLHGIGFPAYGRYGNDRYVGPGLSKRWTGQTHGQYVVSFRHAATAVSLVVWSRGGQWRAKVDGQYVGKGPLSAGHDYAFHTLSIRLPRGRARSHTVQVELSDGAWLAGMRTNRRARVTPTTAPRPKPIYWLGDSFFVGAGARYPGFSDLVHVTSRRLGFREVPVDALGGTGYVATNRVARFPSFLARARANLGQLSPRPAVIVVGGSINDAPFGRRRVRDAALRLFAYLSRVAPSAKVVAVPFTSRYPPPPGVEAAMAGVADAVRSNPRVSLLSLPTDVEQSKRGDPAALAPLQRADGHPSQLGHALYARLIAKHISGRLRP